MTENSNLIFRRMTLERKIWQESAGDGERIYVDVCLNFDVILNGPGRFGSWPDCKEAIINFGVEIETDKRRKVEDLRRFAEEMKEGDIVVLKTGTEFVYAVGIIVENYSWNDLFSDVDGWNIQHVRRVKWIWDKSLNGGDPMKFPVETLKRGDTTQLIGNKPLRKPVLDWLESLKLDYNKVDLKVRDLPEPSEEVILDQIGEFLFSKGVSSNSIENLKEGIDDLQMIARWYDDDPYKNPSEFETEAFLIIPILRKLGWTPQKMALELIIPGKHKKIDITLYSRLPRSTENMIALVEAKRKDNSVFRAFDQVKDYARTLPGVNRLIVTDGIRYGIYLKVNDEWNIHAYMNLTRFKKECKIYNCHGILEALWVMSPEWSYEQ